MATKVENPSNLIAGMGVGVFVIFIFSIALMLVFAFTTQATKTEKILWRGISSLIFAIIMLILIFSERESRFYYSGFEQEIYDSSFIPRVAVVIVMVLFSMISTILVFDESGISKETSTVDVEYTALWQD